MISDLIKWVLYQVVVRFHLESDNEWLRKKVDELQTEIKAERERTESERQRGEQAKERSDTIILQLTRQLEQSQRLIEYHQDPWWRRWFRRSRTSEEETR